MVTLTGCTISGNSFPGLFLFHGTATLTRSRPSRRSGAATLSSPAIAFRRPPPKRLGLAAGQ
jgi:hypothetical protein